MSSPLDEDAPALARVAVQAVTVLNDATADSVDYPGLSGPRDIEAVLSALARLSDELQETATHLDDYLSDQLREQRLKRAKGSSQTPVSVVGVAGGHWPRSATQPCTCPPCSPQPNWRCLRWARPTRAKRPVYPPGGWAVKGLPGVSRGGNCPHPRHGP